MDNSRYGTDSSRNGLTIWLDFRNSIVLNHRFFFDESNELLKIIKDCTEYLTIYLSRGATLYRGRIITEEMENKNYRSKDNNFQVLNRKEIGAPPYTEAKPGRLNPEHISYLYVADSEKCAVSETRPEIGTTVAIGKCNLKKDLKCISFLDWPSAHISQAERVALCYVKSAFGRAVIDPIDYLPTQAVAEFILKLGYDGVAYPSSQTEGGINYLIFNPKMCKFTSTVAHDISGIQYKWK